MSQIVLLSTITCPHCDHAVAESMPENACVVFFDCPQCSATLRPLAGDCCVFCSYGSVPCPPVQRDGKAGCCC